MVKSIVRQEMVSQFTKFKFGISEILQENSGQVYNDLSKMALDISELTNKVDESKYSNQFEHHVI